MDGWTDGSDVTAGELFARRSSKESGEQKLSMPRGSAQICEKQTGKGAFIYDVRTEGEGVSPKEDVVREVAWI